MAKKLKIAFLNIYQFERGAETFVSELTRRLVKRHRVKVFAGDEIPSKRWPILWRAFLDPRGLQIFWFTLKKLPAIWREKFDVVIPINGSWQPALVRIITWIYGGKMIISGQSGIGWDDRNNLWCFPNAFVALSSKAASWARRVNPFIKIKHIPNGVDIKKFTPNGPRFKTKLKKPIVLCVGALTQTKRIDLAIKATSKLKDASLLVVGDGELRQEIQKLGEKLLADRFQLTHVSFEEMPKVYRAADVFTLVSEPYYSFEIVLVEAMASGLPVVANNDPIRREIVGEAGILVDPMNISSYTKALQKTLEREWGDKPKKQAEKFDWDKITELYEGLFESIV